MSFTRLPSTATMKNNPPNNNMTNNNKAKITTQPPFPFCTSPTQCVGGQGEPLKLPLIKQFLFTLIFISWAFLAYLVVFVLPPLYLP